MVSAGWQLALGIWIIVVLFWIFGGAFIWKLSGRRRGIGHPFKETWKVFFSWILPPWRRAVKVFIVMALITAGLALIGSAPRYTTYTLQTGERYLLTEHPVLQNVPDAVCYTEVTPTGSSEVCSIINRRITVYRYELIGFPIESTYQLWWLDPGMLLIGLGLIIAGLLVAAYWVAKANNRLYGVA